jgi:hypothetical protein
VIRELALMLVGALIGALAASVSGGWYELAAWYLRHKHSSLWVTLRYMQPHGVTTWVVSVERGDAQERQLSRSTIRALAVIYALFTTRRAEGAEEREDNG